MLSSIDYISNYKNNGDDQECDKGAVAKVFRINIGVVIAKFCSSCRKVEIVPIVAMRETFSPKITCNSV